MNIDQQIKKCLAQGQIKVGVHFGVYQAVLIEGITEKARISSDKGFWYVLSTLVATRVNDATLEKETQETYRWSLSIQSMTVEDRLVQNSFIRICIVGDLIQIDHHYTGMTSCLGIPGCQSRTIQRSSFGEALALLPSIPFTPETCVANVL